MFVLIQFSTICIADDQKGLIKEPEPIKMVYNNAQEFSIYSEPNFSGKFIENAKFCDKFRVLSNSIDGEWYEIMTGTGAVGYIQKYWAVSENPKITESNFFKHMIDRLREKNPSWSIEDCKIILSNKVRIGMNKNQCREAWGEPTNTSNTIFKYSTNTQWCYGEYCSNALYFENGILETIHTGDDK